MKEKIINKIEKGKNRSEKQGKKKYLSLFTLLFSFTLYAQTTGLSTDQNFIYTKNCLNEDCSRKTEAVQYSDGLGRAKQVISIKASPNGKDIVIPSEYDSFGRQLRSYLPVPQTGTQNGAIYTDPKANAAQAYGSDPYFYSESVQENAPGGKLLSQRKPGSDHLGHSVQYGYGVNAADEVKKYTVTTSWLNGATSNAVSPAGNYGAGELMKTSVTDEDGHQTTEYKNGKGQTVLVKKQNTETYYLYNKYGQLAYVIPPLAVSQPLTGTVLDELCYQYRYDSRSRQVEKKLPGKGWEYIVYDKQDRVLMTQDANMGASRQWLFTKYDRFGRTVYTGIFTSAQNYGSEGRQAEQNTANAAAVSQNESRNPGGFSANGVTAYYTNSAYPTAFTKILSINYFDTYPAETPARPSQVFGKNTIGDNLAMAVNTKNLPTASYVKNIEDDNWTKSYIWYDEKARAVGTYAVNHLGGYTKTESLPDFAGVVQQTRLTHVRLASDTPKVITQTFEYDSQNRLKKQWHQVDSNPQELLSENIYNDLSRLIQKKVGNSLQSIDYTYNMRGATTRVNDPANPGNDLFAYALSFFDPSDNITGKYSGNIKEVSWKSAQDNILRKYAYRYDDLNRMTQGIYSEPDASLPQNNFFNETAAYDLGGNITSLQRNAKGQFSATAELIDNLTYTYTGNRLSTVTDNSTNYRGYPDTSGNRISYDVNGNMISHRDKGILQIDYNILDLPKYIKFNEAVPSRGGARYVNTTYLYSASGSKVRKIYQYKDGTNAYLASKTTDYLDGFQYESDATLANPAAPFILKFVPTSEGYYNFENNKYIYSYTDHLGNVRVSYFKNTNGSAEVLEENNFYPFGMKHEGYNQTAGNPSYNYQYGGKELQKETGWSDFGARMYMSDIARWGVIDPLAETTTRVNPYNYALNNPVMFIDPDGRKAFAPEPVEDNVPRGGLADFYLRGGNGSYNEFLGKDMLLFYKGANGAYGGGGSSASAEDNIDSFVRNGVSYEVAVKVSQNGAISFDEFAYHNTVNDLNYYLNNPKQEGLNLVKLFDSALKNKAGKVLTPDELIKKYKLSPKLKDAINSITVLANNKVKIDWKNETSINMFSKINVYDGILSLQRTFINSPEEPGRGWNGYIVTGGAIEFNDSKTLFIMYNGIYNYYPKTKTISKNGAGF
ncbi:DUF6443 domain-containing protein [Chryseobacterium gambrini]|uniref:DUF6443 domain-containing protein n=1 Tax=Chryseobacterium gambrini TaxID=373672 RepID=A0ABM8KB17_9FLAO|nr:DUF6443 domain-containing protein [Chryseobacterium gambrini]